MAADDKKLRIDALQRVEILTKLAGIFCTAGKNNPPTLFVVEMDKGDNIDRAARTMAGNTQHPLIIADADLAIDEVDGMAVGRIESVGDSLFRKIDENRNGVLVIQDAGRISAGNGHILERVLDGKPLTLPGMDHPVDFSGWTVIMAADKGEQVAPGLKGRAAAVVSFDKFSPKM